MRDRRLGQAAAVCALLLAPGFTRGAAARVEPGQAPRADASVLAALDRGDGAVDVIVGVRDDTPSARALAAHPDPSGEPGRRVRRLAAQRRLAKEMAPGSLAVRREYESLSMLAGRATRDGVLALANRRDVLWVTLDGVRRKHESFAQPAQTLIRSDSTNTLGFDGTGQTIAVIDTGVDYGIAELGGGGFPNAKVVGGADLGDGDADPLDCDGHGTSVASIAAGPMGVAPGAKIVALKVTSQDGCDTAEDSVILSAFDWAIANRAAHGITAVNLSFGGIFTDGRDHGYCDEAYPQYAAAVESANAEGIAVVVSSGNEGLTNSIAIPACVSTVISAGAVYADSFPTVAWQDAGGGTFCEDRGAMPDTHVCFSNSASVLSLLAPGAFWQAPTRGGQIEYFHGTSASAPAVAGAVALIRQARPELPPSAVKSLLRATGRAVANRANGILTPRIDTLAAVELAAAAFAPFDGTAVPIPDGTGSAAASATITGFTGLMASVQAVVEIEHDDPRQLSATLTGPDGTSVRLHERTGDPQRPINAVYGKTLAASRSLAVFTGKPANGVWTLTVTDATPTVAGRIRNFAVRLVAGQPAAAIPPGADAVVLPIVGHVQGTRLFLTDARLYNPQEEEQTFSLFYVAQGLSGAQAVQATRTIAPGQVLALDDVVGSEFGYADSIGELTLVSPAPGLMASSRAYTRGDHGTFGLFVPALSSGDGLAAGQTATANGLSKGPRFHTNTGFTEVSGAPATVKMEIFGGNGAFLGSTTRTAPGNGSVLVTDVIGERGLGATPNFRVDYTVTGGAGRVIPFATFIDDATGDGVFQAAAAPAASSEDIVIAQASHATGANGDFFRTDLHVTNLGTAPATLTLSLIPRALAGTPGPPRVHTLAPGQTFESLDVLSGEFGLGNSSAAGLRIRPSEPARLAVSTRTYVEKFGGTFGFSIPGLPASDAIGAGDGKSTVIQLDSSSSPQGFRANFGFAEVAGADATVSVRVKRGDTGDDIGYGLYEVPAGTSFQATSSGVLPPTGASNVYLQFEVQAGAGRVLAYGVAIDNTSGDAIYIPAKREP
ncbi:MAG: S8 family serine peptidase [Thermoanaerobaculia bacterium]